MASKNDFAYFGGGCFWCMEAVFKTLKGVESVMPGYAGGDKPYPSYEEVCSGKTGHAEVVRVEFDPAAVPYEDLLKIFFEAHDPTTLNRQGNDAGTQYRSIILFTDKRQQESALNFIKDLEAKKKFSSPFVTEVKPLDRFYEAEIYHRDYFTRNKNAPYCRLVIAPKIEKIGKRLKK